MKYTILTLGNPERRHRVETIHRVMEGHDYVPIPAVDGRIPEVLKWHEELNGYKYLMEEWRPGELGLWYSNINAWQYCANSKENLLVFEDDAIPREDFRVTINSTLPPRGFDFASYYTPERNFAQAAPFYFVETEQEHGNICMLYSAKGAAKILDMLSTEGIEYPVDIWVFKKAKFAKELKGYSPRRISKIVVDHDFNLPTNIHNDERIFVDAVQRTGE